jgi:endoglycosylceramidase
MSKRCGWAGWGAMLVCGLALVGPAASSARPRPVRPSLDRASTHGRWLIDSHGRILLLHGLNLVAKLSPYTPASLGFGNDDAQFLAANGFTAIRLGVIYAGVEPRPGAYDQSYLNSIAHTVAVLRSHGIYTLLDFHQDQYNEQFQGEGFPNWAVQTGGLSNPQDGFPGNYFGDPALGHAFSAFFANTRGPGGVGLEDRYASAWQHVAKRFAHTPGILGYDLINEPAPGTEDLACLSAAGCPDFERGRLIHLYRKVSSAIRMVDKTTPIFYEPVVVAGTGFPTHLPRLNDRHAVYDWHLYVAPKAQAAMFKRAYTSTGGQEPQFLTEFGSTVDTSTIVDAEDLADRHLIGWMEWAYFNNGSSSFAGTPSLVTNPHRPPVGTNIDRAQLDALVRPYASAIAGVPRSMSYNPATRTFKLRYRPNAAATAPTLVQAAKLVYPDGHHITISGGRVLHDDNGVITIHSTAKQLVTIIIKP